MQAHQHHLIVTAAHNRSTHAIGCDMFHLRGMAGFGGWPLRPNVLDLEEWAPPLSRSHSPHTPPHRHGTAPPHLPVAPAPPFPLPGYGATALGADGGVAWSVGGPQHPALAPPSLPVCGAPSTQMGAWKVHERGMRLLHACGYVSAPGQAPRPLSPLPPPRPPSPFPLPPRPSTRPTPSPPGTRCLPCQSLVMQ